jgi:hypothetical protein
MIAKLRAAEAARRLVVSGDIQTGFGRLVEAGRPELTIEWEILNPRWDPLFSLDPSEGLAPCLTVSA